MTAKSKQMRKTPYETTSSTHSSPPPSQYSTIKTPSCNDPPIGNKRKIVDLLSENEESDSSEAEFILENTPGHSSKTAPSKRALHRNPKLPGPDSNYVRYLPDEIKRTRAVPDLIKILPRLLQSTTTQKRIT